MSQQPVLGRLGLPAVLWQDTALGRVHLASCGDSRRWPAVFEVWGDGVPTLIGAPEDGSSRVFPVRLVTPAGAVDGEFRPVVLPTDDHSVSRRTSAFGLQLGATLWSVRTVSARSFVFERDGVEIASLRAGQLTVSAGASPTDHTAIVALLTSAESTTLTSTLLPPDGAGPLVRSGLQRPADWHPPTGPDGVVADRLVRPSPTSLGFWISSQPQGSVVWDDAGTTAGITLPEVGDLTRPLRVTVSHRGATSTGSLAPPRSATADRGGLLDRLPRPARGILDGARRLLVADPLPERLIGAVDSVPWEVRATGDLTRAILRDDVLVATAWGALLSATRPADHDRATLAVAVALHRCSRFLRAPR